jgi:hypothetical protein
VDNFGGSDILMTRIPVLFVIVVIAISSLCVMVGPCSIIDSELLGVDVLEEVAILHGMIVFGMKLVGTLQGLVVVILVVVAITWLLIHVDFMTILARTHAFEGITAVMPPITVVSVVTVVVASITRSRLLFQPWSLRLSSQHDGCLGRDGPPTSSLIIFSVSSTSA